MNNLNYAGFWWRVLASLLDILILVIPTKLMGLVIRALFQMPFSMINFKSFSAMTPKEQIIEGLLIMLGVLAGWGYAAGLQSSRWQATVGQKICKLTVTTLDGQRISFARASARFYATIAPSLLVIPAYFLADPSKPAEAWCNIVAQISHLLAASIGNIDYLAAAFSKRKQTLHDMVAGTVVLRNKDN